MRLDAGSVLLVVVLLSALLPRATAPRHRRQGLTASGGPPGPFFPVGRAGLCPSQCQQEQDVMLCHHADGLNMVHLAQCVTNASIGISVVELRSTQNLCTCFLLDLVRQTTSRRVIVFTPTSCSQTLLINCYPVLPERGKNMAHTGVVAGLVMEQSDAGWRRATRRHLAWLWNTVSALKSNANRFRYRALVIKTVKNVYWTNSGMKAGAMDRIVPFMLYRDGHLGPLYGGGRQGWYDFHDFQPAVEAVSKHKWIPMTNYKQQQTPKAEGQGSNKVPQDKNYVVVTEHSKTVDQQQVQTNENVQTYTDTEEKMDSESPVTNKSGSNGKRMAVVIFIACMAVAICLLICFVEICRRPKKRRGVKIKLPGAEREGSIMRKFSVMVGLEDDDEEETVPECVCPQTEAHEEDLPKADTKRRESVKDRCTSQEIKRRLSQPYSHWSAEDFELAREVDEDKTTEGEEGGSKTKEKNSSEHLIGKIPSYEEVRRQKDKKPSKGGRNVHQRVPPEMEALYKERTQGRCISGASKTKRVGPRQGEVWTQVNVFDIEDEVSGKRQPQNVLYGNPHKKNGGKKSKKVRSKERDVNESRSSNACSLCEVEQNQSFRRVIPDARTVMNVPLTYTTLVPYEQTPDMVSTLPHTERVPSPQSRRPPETNVPAMHGIIPGANITQQPAAAVENQLPWRQPVAEETRAVETEKSPEEDVLFRATTQPLPRDPAKSLLDSLFIASENPNLDTKTTAQQSSKPSDEEAREEDLGETRKRTFSEYMNDRWQMGIVDSGKDGILEDGLRLENVTNASTVGMETKDSEKSVEPADSGTPLAGETIEISATGGSSWERPESGQSDREQLETDRRIKDEEKQPVIPQDDKENSGGGRKEAKDEKEEEGGEEEREEVEKKDDEAIKHTTLVENDMLKDSEWGSNDKSKGDEEIAEGADSDASVRNKKRRRRKKKKGEAGAGKEDTKEEEEEEAPPKDDAAPESRKGKKRKKKRRKKRGREKHARWMDRSQSASASSQNDSPADSPRVGTANTRHEQGFYMGYGYAQYLIKYLLPQLYGGKHPAMATKPWAYSRPSRQPTRHRSAEMYPDKDGTKAKGHEGRGKRISKSSDHSSGQGELASPGVDGSLDDPGPAPLPLFTTTRHDWSPSPDSSWPLNKVHNVREKPDREKWLEGTTKKPHEKCQEGCQGKRRGHDVENADSPNPEKRGDGQAEQDTGAPACWFDLLNKGHGGHKSKGQRIKVCWGLHGHGNVLETGREDGETGKPDSKEKSGNRCGEPGLFTKAPNIGHRTHVDPFDADRFPQSAAHSNQADKADDLHSMLSRKPRVCLGLHSALSDNKIDDLGKREHLKKNGSASQRSPTRVSKGKSGKRKASSQKTAAPLCRFHAQTTVAYSDQPTQAQGRSKTSPTDAEENLPSTSNRNEQPTQAQGRSKTSPADAEENLPSTSNRNESNEQDYPLVRWDKGGESEADVDVSPAFPTPAMGSHSLFPSASEIQRFTSGMGGSSPTTPFSELYSQFQKIEQERACQNMWGAAATANLNFSHRALTPQSSNLNFSHRALTPQSSSTQTLAQPSSSLDRSPSFLTSEMDSELLPTFSLSGACSSQYTLGPRTPFSPPEISSAAATTTSDDSSSRERRTVLTRPRSSSSGVTAVSAGKFPSASSSRSSLSVRESRSSTCSEGSAREFSLCRVTSRKRTRSDREDSDGAFPSTSQPSIHHI